MQQTLLTLKICSDRARLERTGLQDTREYRGERMRAERDESVLRWNESVRNESRRHVKSRPHSRTAPLDAIKNWYSRTVTFFSHTNVTGVPS